MVQGEVRVRTADVLGGGQVSAGAGVAGGRIMSYARSALGADRDIQSMTDAAAAMTTNVAYRGHMPPTYEFCRPRSNPNLTLNPNSNSKY